MECIEIEVNLKMTFEEHLEFVEMIRNCWENRIESLKITTHY